MAVTIFSSGPTPIKNFTLFGMKPSCSRSAIRPITVPLRTGLSLLNLLVPTSGDYRTWPEQWAIDSVQQARKAYRNIEFGAATIDERRLRITGGGKLLEATLTRIDPAPCGG